MFNQSINGSLVIVKSCDSNDPVCDAGGRFDWWWWLVYACQHAILMSLKAYEGGVVLVADNYISDGTRRYLEDSFVAQLVLVCGYLWWMWMFAMLGCKLLQTLFVTVYMAVIDPLSFCFSLVKRMFILVKTVVPFGKSLQCVRFIFWANITAIARIFYFMTGNTYLGCTIIIAAIILGGLVVACLHVYQDHWLIRDNVVFLGNNIYVKSLTFEQYIVSPPLRLASVYGAVLGASANTWLCYFVCFMSLYVISGVDCLCVIPLCIALLLCGGRECTIQTTADEEEQTDTILIENTPCVLSTATVGRQEAKKGKTKNRSRRMRVIRVTTQNPNAAKYANVRTLEEVYDEIDSYRPFDFGGEMDDWAEDTNDYDFYDDPDVSQEDKNKKTHEISAAFRMRAAANRFAKWRRRKGLQEALADGNLTREQVVTEINVRFALSLMSTWFERFRVAPSEDMNIFYTQVLNTYGIRRLEEIRFCPSVVIPVSSDVVVNVTCFKDFSLIQEQYMAIAKKQKDARDKLKAAPRKSRDLKVDTTTVVCGRLDDPHTVAMDGTVQEGVIISNETCLRKSLEPVSLKTEVVFKPFSVLEESSAWGYAPVQHGAMVDSPVKYLRCLEEGLSDEDDVLDVLYEDGYVRSDGSAFETIDQLRNAIVDGKWKKKSDGRQHASYLGMTLMDLGEIIRATYTNVVKQYSIDYCNDTYDVKCKCAECNNIKGLEEFTTVRDYRSLNLKTVLGLERTFQRSTWSDVCHTCKSDKIKASITLSGEKSCVTCKGVFPVAAFTKGERVLPSCLTCRRDYVRKSLATGEQHVGSAERFIPLAKDDTLLQALADIRVTGPNRGDYIRFIQYIRKIKSPVREEIQGIAFSLSSEPTAELYQQVISEYIDAKGLEFVKKCGVNFEQLKKEQDAKDLLKSQPSTSTSIVVNNVSYADVVKRRVQEAVRAVPKTVMAVKESPKAAQEVWFTSRLENTKKVVKTIDSVTDTVKLNPVVHVPIQVTKQPPVVEDVSMLTVGVQQSAGLLRAIEVMQNSILALQEQVTALSKAIAVSNDGSSSSSGKKNKDVVVVKHMSSQAGEKIKTTTRETHISKKDKASMLESKAFACQTDQIPVSALIQPLEKIRKIFVVTPPLQEASRTCPYVKPTKETVIVTVPSSSGYRGELDNCVVEEAFEDAVSEHGDVIADPKNKTVDEPTVAKQESLIRETQIPQSHDIRVNAVYGESDNVWSFNCVCSAISLVQNYVLLTLYTVNHVDTKDMPDVNFMTSEGKDKKVTIKSITFPERVNKLAVLDNLTHATRQSDGWFDLDEECVVFNNTTALNDANSPNYNPATALLVLALPCKDQLTSRKVAEAFDLMQIPSTRIATEAVSKGCKVVAAGKGKTTTCVGHGELIALNEYAPGQFRIRHTASICDEKQFGGGMSGTLVWCYDDRVSKYLPFGLHYGSLQGNNIAYALINTTVKQSPEFKKFLQSINK